MNEPKTSIHLQEKSGAGISPMILAGILFLAGVLLYGGYLYVSGRLGPDVDLDEGLATTGFDRSGPKPGEPSRSTPDTIEAEPMHPDPGAQDTSTLDESKADMPPLDESDAFVRDLLAGLSDRREYAKWIEMEHLLPKMTTVIDNVSRGNLPALRLRALAPEGKFPVIERSPDVYLMDPKGYHRYDVYADTLAALDIPAVLQIYGTLKPLFDSAYAELGYPDRNFEVVLRRAIDHLLEVPVLSGEVELVRPSVMYRFADPKLESLSQAQKQLLRMGPRNVRIIQSVLRNVLAQLGPQDTGPGKARASG